MNWTPKVRQKTFGVQFFFATSSFQRFPPVVCKRNTDFSRFFTFRRPTTSCFQCFLCFVGRRRAFFCNFCVSLTSDERFSAFSACRLQAKRCFWQFSKKNHKRKPVFGVFRSSLASETLFSAFSAFRSRAMNDFQGFLIFPKGWEMQSAAFFGFPKFGKANF